MFWYKDEATFHRFRAILADPDHVGPDYAKWRENAQKTFDAAVKKGIILIKIEANPEEFAAFCKVHAYRLDSKARQVFTAAKVSEKTGQG